MSAVMVIAEVGVSHGGRLDEAIKLIDGAKRAGADIVKFQVFDPAEHTGEYRALLESLVIPGDGWLDVLIDHCAEVGIDWLATPFDVPSIDAIVARKPKWLKISSRHVRDHAFLRAIRERWDGDVIQSFGASTEPEAQAADEIVVACVLMHCVSAYPAPLSACNLIEGLPDFNWINRVNDQAAIGWSDHTANPLIPALAVARGASWIEAHIKSETSGGPDLAASLSIDDFALMVRYVRDAYVAVWGCDEEPGTYRGCEAAARASFPVTE